MKNSIKLIFSLLMAAQTLPAIADEKLTIPYQKFTLDNGLTLLVHEDHKTPIVAVNIWYHVGSKDEVAGKTGFAHLFEHLMFNGSENHDGEYFTPMEKIGATQMNGTTSNDRTNYFQNVPTAALDVALWMESDRMGHLLGAITQEKLDEQRGVVKNEKRQRESQPYGKVWSLLNKNSLAADHPYSWPVIGSMEDLDNATLDDVHNWFKTYYGAANAVVTLAGDITPEEALAKVNKYFGDIPAGPPVTHRSRWISKIDGNRRVVMQDQVPQPRLYQVWNVPSWNDATFAQFNILEKLLLSGKNSRLYKRLVYDDQIATSVHGGYWAAEITGQFLIYASPKPGVPLEKLELAIADELKRLAEDGPTRKELARINTTMKADYLRGIEGVGGFTGKANLLAQSYVFTKDPQYYGKALADAANVSAKQLQRTAAKWLSSDHLSLMVEPVAKFQTQLSDVDRSKLPEIATPADLVMPLLQKTQLKNGLEIIVAQRGTLPLVEITLQLNAGHAADAQFSPGTNSLTMAMLDEGTKKLSSLELSAKLDALGATLSTAATLDTSTVHLSALSDNLEDSLELFSAVITQPQFPEKELPRVKASQLAKIKHEKASPFSMALRTLPPLLYGKDHAYHTSFTGSGTTSDIEAMSTEALRTFHKTWFRPDNAQLIIVGDTSLDAILPLLEDQFGDWENPAIPQPKKTLSQTTLPQQQRVFLIDKPGSESSLVIAGQLAPPENNPNAIEQNLLNKVLGGMFTSRINMNLREEKHWSYGARAALLSARAQRPYLFYAQVQVDKTAASMSEILMEIQAIQESRPVTTDELSKVKSNLTLKLPGQMETLGAVNGAIAANLRFDRDDNYQQTLVSLVGQVSLEQVQAESQTLLHPDQLTWIIIGDLKQIEQSIRDLKLGDTEVLSITK